MIYDHYNKIETLKNWNRSEKKTIVLKDEGDISFSDDKIIERKVTFTNIYGFEKEFILIFSRKANLSYRDGIVTHYNEPTDTVSILPINE